VAAIVLLVWAHLVPSGYGAVRDAVSHYGASRYHPLYRLMVISMGLGALLLALALARSTALPGARLAWLWIFAATRIAIAAFMADDPHAPPTRTGRVHVALAAGAFACIAFASVEIAAALSKQAGWSQIDPLLWAISIAVVVFAVLTLVCRTNRRAAAYFGAVERLLYLAMFGWLLTVTLHLLSLSG
jgi:hypothetical protein